MILHNTLLVLVLVPLLSAFLQNSTKTKRTLSDQIYSHGDAKAVLFYMENPQTVDIPELQAAASSPGLKNFYSAPAKPLALVSVQQPIQVFEQDGPKQVAEQQVLYEFQQTPTNAVSNVHVKQLFQPSAEVTTHLPLYQGEALPTAQALSSIHPATPVITGSHQFMRTHPHALGFSGTASQNPATSATIVSPVQHNIYTNHAINTPSFGYNYNNPLLSESQLYQNPQTTPKQPPGKYIYLNGKIVYSPTHISPQGKVPSNSIYHKGIYHNQQKLPLINYGQKHNNPVLQKAQGNPGGTHGHYVARPQEKLTPPSSLIPPITRNRFQAPKQFQQIDKPSAPVQQDVADDEEERENEEDEEDVEDDDEDAATENKEEETENGDFEEEEDAYGYETFPFEDIDYNDERDNSHYKPRKVRKNKGRNRNEESEYDEDREDTNRGSSNLSAKYHNQPDQSRRHRNSPKYEAGENFGYYEGYSTNSKYKSPKHGKKNGKKYSEKPSGKYKKVKFSKVMGGKPKIETIEGKFSENIPITHKHKVFKERWYVTTDREGAPSKKVNK